MISIITSQGRCCVFPKVPLRRVERSEMGRLRQQLLSVADGAGGDQAAAELAEQIGVVLGAVQDSLRASSEEGERCGGALHEPVDDYAAARFLLAAKFNTALATQYIREYLQWRVRIQGCCKPPEQWLDMGAVVAPFEDRLGRPVVVMRCKHLVAQDVPLEVMEQGFSMNIIIIMIIIIIIVCV